MECGMWSENSTEIQYSYAKSLVLETYLTPHSTFLIPPKLLRNLDVLYKVTLAVGFLAIDHEMTT